MSVIDLTRLQTGLLAQKNLSDKALKLQEAFRYHQSTPGESPYASARNLVIVLGIVILLLFVVSKILQRKSIPVAERNPRKFFSNVLRQLGATYSDRLLLHRAAHRAELHQPAMMLLSPELFERYALAWADGIHIAFIRDNVRARFKAIADRAFAPRTPDR